MVASGVFYRLEVHSVTQPIVYKNSSGDEIANVNFFLQHHTCRGQRLRPLNEFVISTKHLRYLPTHQTDF